MRAKVDKQKQVESFWNAKPCDSDRSTRPEGTREYFNEIERDRYALQDHILDVIGWTSWTGKKVLEIGTGVGTDARRIVAHGGQYTGVNVDQGSTDATAAALAAFDLAGSVRKASATALPFKDGSFDVVYSFGVLHHIPDVDAAIREIRRVLRPGGELLVMVYNRTSINYYVEILLLRRLFLRLLGLPGAVRVMSMLGFPKETLMRHRDLYKTLGPMNNEEWLSRNTDGPDNPYSRVYGRAEIESLLRSFSVERNQVYFFDHRHWGIFGRLLPKFFIHALGKRWGWHRVVYAIKPAESA
jgi:SAM-dependent methyltransferase